MLASILSALVSLPFVAFTLQGVIEQGTYYNEFASKSLHAIMVLISVSGGVAAVTLGAITCRAACCRSHYRPEEQATFSGGEDSLALKKIRVEGLEPEPSIIKANASFPPPIYSGNALDPDAEGQIQYQRLLDNQNGTLPAS